MIADAHCHLADLEDPDGAVAEAAAGRVGPILGVSMGPEDGARVLELKGRHPRSVLAGIGLHPSRIPLLTDAAVDRELELAAARAGRADFIGEIGLDFKDAPERAQQVRQHATLERLLDLAARERLPVNLHTRRADRVLLEIARTFSSRTGLPALLHWFTHSRRLVRRCAQAGLFISAGPSVLRDPAQLEVARSIDRDYLLVETDSPVAYAGVPARPVLARQVAAALAGARGEDPGGLEETLAANLARFRLRPSAADRPF